MSNEKAEEIVIITTEVVDTTVTDGTEQQSGTDEVVDEVVVTIGDEAPPQEEKELAEAPTWVKELRKSQRELTRKNKELERQLMDKAQVAETTALGPKPTMADADIDYDAAKFEEALTKWNDKRRAADNESAQRQAAEAKATQAWQSRLDEYGTQKTQLKVKDFSESEAIVSEALNGTQQGIIIQGADNASLVIYALGKNSTKLKEFSAITDPVKFAFAIAKLEKDLKVTTRKVPPPPEKTVTGSAPKSGVVDSQLERLRADAEKTGDYTKVTQYNRQRRAAS